MLNLMDRVASVQESMDEQKAAIKALFESSSIDKTLDGLEFHGPAMEADVDRFFDEQPKEFAQALLEGLRADIESIEEDDMIDPADPNVVMMLTGYAVLHMALQTVYHVADRMTLAATLAGVQTGSPEMALATIDAVNAVTKGLEQQLTAAAKGVFEAYGEGLNG